MKYTLQQAAQTAIDVQNACNLSGVVHSLADICSSLRELPDCTGTAWVNEHPIVTLFIDKLASLNRTQCLCAGNMHNYSRAYTIVEDLAKPNLAELYEGNT